MNGQVLNPHLVEQRAPRDVPQHVLVSLEDVDGYVNRGVLQAYWLLVETPFLKVAEGFAEVPRPHDAVFVLVEKFI